MNRLLFPLLVLAFLLSPGIGAAREQPAIDDSPRAIGLEMPDWFELSFLDLPEDLKKARKDGKKGLIVYLGMKDCPYCEALMNVNFGQEDIVRYTRQHFNTVGLDVLGSRPMVALDGRQSSEREYAVRERLNFTPTLVFYDLDGHEALRLRGYQSPYQHRAALEYVVDAHYRNERFGDYLARADPPPKFEVGGLNQREFFAHPPYALDRTRIPARRPLAVFFEQRDCHACDVLHTEPLGDRQTLDSLALMEVVQLDMRSETPVLTPDGRRLTARQWARELDLFYAPTLIFFDERGHEIIRVESVVRLNRLRNVLEYVLTRGYENYPTFQRWSASRSEMQ